MTDKKAEATTLEPVTVTVIGTKADDIPTSGTVAVTPKASQPNLIVNAVTPLVAIAIRCINVYVGTLLGILSGAMTTDVIPSADFAELFVKCAGLAVAGTVVLTLKDVGTVLSGLEKKYPLLTGSI